MPGRPTPAFPMQLLAVVGVGLIGGSIARAVRERNLAREVLGIGRNPQRLDQAVAGGVIDRASTHLSATADADMVVVCTPVGHVASNVSDVLDAGGTSLVTDAGSVKGNIASAIRSHPQQERFVGSHPLAGSEKSGFEHARTNLFEGRVCVVTPTASTPPRTVQHVTAFWEALGMAVHRMSPDEHDEILAHTSHLPHLAAAALALQVAPQAVPYAATGFHDTTRIASGDPSLWSAILMANRTKVGEAVAELIEDLNRFREALDRDDGAAVLHLLQAARQSRQRFLDSFRGEGAGE